MADPGGGGGGGGVRGLGVRIHPQKPSSDFLIFLINTSFC